LTRDRQLEIFKALEVVNVEPANHNLMIDCAAQRLNQTEVDPLSIPEFGAKLDA